MARRVVVADDDQDLRTIVCDLLFSVGYEVMPACDGEQALALVLEKKPDLLVLDLSMPKMSGWDVAKRLRENPAHAHLPIIAFTAHALRGDEAKAIGAGCNAYVSKPFAPDILLDVMDRLLKATPERVAPPPRAA